MNGESIFRRCLYPQVVLTAQRACELTGIFTAITVRMGIELVRTIYRTPEDRQRRIAAIAADGIQNLGPTFIKVGQMVGSRRDLLPSSVCDELSSLHDSVQPMTRKELESAWYEATEAGTNELAEVRLSGSLLGAGSIACVYEGETPDGSQVAVKLRRPRVARQMSTELSMMYGLTRLAELMPTMRHTQFADLVAYMNKAIYSQVDFRLEAHNTERLRCLFADQAQIVVPAVWQHYSNECMITFDLIPSIGRQHGSSVHAQVLFEAAWDMMFGEGFVHCDLHQGNVYALARDKLAILDAGYSVELPWKVQDALSDFFFALARGDGRRCGEVIADSADPPLTGVKREGLVAEISRHVRQYVRPGNRLDMIGFGSGISEYQQKYGANPSPDFAFPLMSIMVLEGTARTFDPDADMSTGA